MTSNTTRQALRSECSHGVRYARDSPAANFERDAIGFFRWTQEPCGLTVAAAGACMHDEAVGMIASGQAELSVMTWRGKMGTSFRGTAGTMELICK